MRRIVLAMCLAAFPVGAQDARVGADDMAGAVLFRSHCAGCHGVSAKGDGPVAGLLTVPVPDLTMLAARDGGVFPLARVVQTIDGRRLLRAHGGPMPVFGPMMGGGSAVIDDADGAIIETRGDILRIVDHLLSVQAD